MSHRSDVQAEVLAEVEELQAQNVALHEENEALKGELGAFDVSFFEELEDLKFKYDEMSRHLTQYRQEYGDLP